MQSSHFALMAFTLFNVVRIAAYAPQIIKIARDENGATAVSSLTWAMFAFSHASTVAYALLTTNDLVLAWVFTGNTFACVMIVGLTALRRRQFRTRMNALHAGAQELRCPPQYHRWANPSPRVRPTNAESGQTIRVHARRISGCFVAALILLGYFSSVGFARGGETDPIVGTRRASDFASCSYDALKQSCACSLACVGFPLSFSELAGSIKIYYRAKPFGDEHDSQYLGQLDLLVQECSPHRTAKRLRSTEPREAPSTSILRSEPAARGLAR